MSTRKQKESNSLFFDQILDAFSAEDVPQEYVQKLAGLKNRLLNPSVPTKAAKDFCMKEAVLAFGLLPTGFDEVVDRAPDEEEGSIKWKIEEIPETKGFVVSSFMRKSRSFNLDADYIIEIGSLLVNYSKNFERSSEAVCRTALDLTLNEVLTVMVRAS